LGLGPSGRHQIGWQDHQRDADDRRQGNDMRLQRWADRRGEIVMGEMRRDHEEDADHQVVDAEIGEIEPITGIARVAWSAVVSATWFATKPASLEPLRCR